MKKIKQIILLWLIVGLLSNCASTVTLLAGGSVSGSTISNASHGKDNIDDVVSKANTGLLGFNGQLTFSRATYTDASFIKAMDSTHLQIIRIPCGSGARYYNWRDPNSQPNLADLKALAIAFPDIDKTIVLNMITDNLESQLKWLDTLHKMGTYKNSVNIELSNESNTANSEELNKFGGVEGYARECARWIVAIKAQFSKQGVVGSFGIPAGQKGGRAVRDYDRKILQANPDVDLIMHYHNPREYVFNGIVDTALVRHLIDSIKRAEFGDFPWARIKVTEYNLRNEDDDKDIFFKDDYQHGLAASFMMKVLYENGAKEVLFHNITGAEGNGAILIIGKNSSLSPTGRDIGDFIESTKQ